MDDLMDHDDMSSPPYFGEEERYLEEDAEEGEELEMFQSPVSGFGESELRSLEELVEAEVEVEGEEEEEEEEEEGDEGDGSKIDDTQIENTAIQVYQDTHPSREQIAVGGREIGEHEAIWSVSSFRPDWGPDKLRDNNALTYWQSDCPNPNKNHTVDLNFHQATFIRQVSLFIDYFQDESYTPKTIAIRGGTTSRDLYEIMTVECEPEFVGWLNADITTKNDGDAFRVFRLQVAILNTHSNVFERFDYVYNDPDEHLRSHLQRSEKEKEAEVEIFLLLDAPTRATLPTYVDVFKRENVSDLIRICHRPSKNNSVDNEYDAQELERDTGIKVSDDIQFEDGGVPGKEAIDSWLNLVEKTRQNQTTIGVHCIAGIGRAPVLIAISLIEDGMDPLDAIAYIRKHRRGALNKNQDIKQLASRHADPSGYPLNPLQSILSTAKD
ncbi:hypothetical protein MFLAVUS_010810 [Mucor flavus]|uniref:Protein tyrosine phosphatase n=1 Tax=Mucor flavus TaxID=439312 RepID=A0ABP9ZDT3_9FUNG